MEYDKKPSQEKMKRIEELVNKKIREDVPIKILTLPRDEAENVFGNEMYDLLPIPDNVETLKIVVIDGM